MRLIKPLTVVLLAGISAVFGSCFWLNLPVNTESSADAEFHQVVSLEPGGTVRLDCPAGDVEIQGGDRMEVEVSARQEGGSSYTWSWFRGWSARPAPQISVESADNVVTITTVASEASDLQPNIHFLLLVPESVKLKDIHLGRGSLTVADVYGELAATIGEGDLTVENYSGSIEAAVESGSIEAEVLDLRDEDKIILTVGEGDIGLALEKKVGAKLEASAEAGEITGDFDLKAAAGANSISVQLGAGNAAITLKALKGDIEVKKIE